MWKQSEKNKKSKSVTSDGRNGRVWHMANALSNESQIFFVFVFQILLF